MLEAPLHLVVFLLDDTRYAFSVDCVQRIVRAVQITPLPNAPDVIPGIINVGGEVIAVAEPRLRFGLPQREIQLSDQMILVRAKTRTFAFLVDSVIGVTAVSDEGLVDAESVAPGVELQGVAHLPDGLVLIYDIDAFLSLQEDRQLQRALSATQA